MCVTPASVPLRRLAPRAVRASGESASNATVAVVSSPCSKIVTRTVHSRSVPSSGRATSSSCSGVASVTFSTAPGPGNIVLVCPSSQRTT